ncbi:MAG: tetratricopeptide repeat protein [Lysobacteraceae bacterium]|nr:MAG: tetratricopeptide repeat protein [Xanthomonadaceae bacterium]
MRSTATESGTDAHRRRAFELLREALDVDETARAAFIERHAAGDASLADDVRELLAGNRTNLLDEDASALAARLVEAAAADALPGGARMGAWRVVTPIGSGGMGTVYLAERDGDGYVQRGALKRIKRGMDSDAVLERFRRERQILSRLDHPNIARLLDGGIADDGRPFLVMEYVEGMPLATWSAQAGIGPRVELVLALCAAVAHAHHRLVVHRDIKPANVLVAADGSPRLLDFGIARLLEADTGDATATAARFVTRAYAAPEQLQGLAVTTATDIFQLGALLLELLGGTRLAGTSGATTQGTTAGGRTSVAKALRGDIGVVVARATDADPARRYATVEAFADDIRRWRDGLPVLARPDSLGYRLRRYVARHRWLVAASALALIAVVGGAAAALWQARAAAAQERIALDRAEAAERVKRFMIDLFQAPDPAHARGAMPRADELLDRGAAQIATALAGEPRMQAELYETIALSYMGLGRFDAGVALLERAREGLAGSEDRMLAARIQTRLGAGQAELGRYADALASLERASRLHASTRQRDRMDDARVESIRGWVLRDLGRYEESAAALRRSLSLAQSVPGEMNPAALRALNNLAYTLQLAGHEQASVEAYERVVSWYAAHESSDSQARLWAEYTFARALREFGQPARAIEILERIRPTLRKVVGDAHADLAGLDIALGLARMDRADPDGPALVADAVARSHRATPQRNMLWAQAEFARAEAAQHVGNEGDAIAGYAAARDAFAGLAGADHPGARECMRRLTALAARDADAAD